MRGVPSSYKVIDRRTGRRVYPSNPTNSRYRLVQPPGPKNALGRVKFMFPNGHAIYLHDTPSRHLFARSQRSYSHGCVRVENPLDLAQEVLNKPSWDRAAIDRVVKRGRTRYVNLDEHLPVLLYYLTARADEHGRVGFRRDLYGRDRTLFAAMEEPADAGRLVFSDEVNKPANEAASGSSVVAAASVQVDNMDEVEHAPAASDAAPSRHASDESAEQPRSSSTDAWRILSTRSAKSGEGPNPLPVIGLRESGLLAPGDGMRMQNPTAP
jgi:hypothetical protein